MISENARNYENVVIRNEQEIGINNFGLDYMSGLEDEIERLNNIIDELEKYFEQEGFWHSLDKIKELKEKYKILDKGE